MPDPTPILHAAMVRALADLDQAGASRVRDRLLSELASVIDQDAPDPETDELVSCWLSEVLAALNR